MSLMFKTWLSTLLISVTLAYAMPNAYATAITTQPTPSAERTGITGWLHRTLRARAHVSQDPSTLVHAGRISMRDIDRWAQAQHLQNTWRGNPKKFPTGGFSYRAGPYSIHGHGANPAAKQRYPGSHSATGPTASISNEHTDKVFRTDGSWGRFEADPNAAHIPLDDSLY